MPVPIRRTVAVAFCAIAIAGCSSILGLNDAGFSLRFLVPEQTPTQLELEVTVGMDRFVVEPGARRDMDPPGRGTLPVRVRLLDHDNSVAEVTLHLAFRNHADHWVHARISPTRPLGHCVGTITPSAISGNETDSLFVMHGSLSRDAVC